MKFLRNSITLGALTLACSIAMVSAQNKSFTGNGTALGGTNSHYILSAAKGGVPSVFNATVRVSGIDNSNAVAFLNFYVGEAFGRVITAAGAVGTNHIYASTNGLVVGDILVLQHVRGDTYERHTVSALAAGRITISGTAATAIQVTAGAGSLPDKVYKMSLRSAEGPFTTVPLPASVPPVSTHRINAHSPFFTGELERPALVELVGTATNELRSVSGYYVKEQLQVQ